MTTPNDGLHLSSLSREKKVRQRLPTEEEGTHDSKRTPKEEVKQDDQRSQSKLIFRPCLPSC